MTDLSSKSAEGDWFIIADPNEVILARGRHMINLSVPQQLAMNTDCNAVGTTTLFAHGQDGKPWTKLPFKMYMPQGWDAKKMSPMYDLSWNGVRIWQNSPQRALQVELNTISGSSKAHTVNFPGRTICPFHLTSVRFSPTFAGDSIEVITPYLEQMYGVHLAIGFMPVNRSEIIEPTFLY